MNRQHNFAGMSMYSEDVPNWANEYPQTYTHFKSISPVLFGLDVWGYSAWEWSKLNFLINGVSWPTFTPCQVMQWSWYSIDWPLVDLDGVIKCYWWPYYCAFGFGQAGITIGFIGFQLIPDDIIYGKVERWYYYGSCPFGEIVNLI